MLALDIKPEALKQEVSLELRRGCTLQCRVFGPDGKPVESFVGLCRHYRPNGFTWGWQQYNLLQGRNGWLQIPGCDPDKPFTTWLLSPDPELGATAELSAKVAAGQPVTIRLEPCGSALAQFADEDGKPLANYFRILNLMITPGVSSLRSRAGIISGDDSTEMEADCVAIPYWAGLSCFLRPGSPYSGANQRTDTEGRSTFPILIPGATYRLMFPNLRKADDTFFKAFPVWDFAAKAGEKVVIPKAITDKRVGVMSP